MPTYLETVQLLASAQKDAARGAPAYSRFVNRRLGRLLAAWAFRRGLSPNAVTGLSALATFGGIAATALLAPAWWVGVLVAVLLVLGYALDSADGQVARLTGRGSPAGEWLDHVVDATKISAMPLALLVGWYRFDAVDRAWLLVPIVHAVVGPVYFFAMILTEQLRRAHGVRSTAAPGGRLPWLRSLVALPTDYGVLCLLFLLYGWISGFVVLYGLVVLATAVYLALALGKWFREMGRLGASAGGAPAA
ncbi:CDP-alcohol phosphatidyltransferase family protein [Cellulomonas massiliensis]|uniref:CDP-alcohol phosphatidyltransferase family protein n=1 Tax=Cellulomonas massiliensis TaxID=1465811 RepID=UPI0002EFA0F9|nr:CDP-alcohol phosphatidyltransferase family protein [Cellulomonas massiliensis]